MIFNERFLTHTGLRNEHGGLIKRVGKIPIYLKGDIMETGNIKGIKTSYNNPDIEKDDSKQHTIIQKNENKKSSMITPVQIKKDAPLSVNKTIVDKTIEKINAEMTERNIRRKFLRNEDLHGRMIVQFIDKDSGKVIKQIPSEDAMKMSKNIDAMIGMFMDNKI